MTRALALLLAALMPLAFPKPLPFAEALRDARERGLLPTSMTSAELEELDRAILRTSFFSATLTEAAVLSRMRALCAELADGSGDQAKAREQLRDELDALDYTPAPDEEGTIKDFRSERRLDLVLETNTAMFQGYGVWRQGQEQPVLDAFPAQELYRLGARNVERHWVDIWTEHGGEVFEGGRMIALKDDPIWVAISRFGNPYPPFDYGSGMDTRDVPRAEAIRLGLMTEDQRVEPQQDPLDAAQLRASVEGIDPAVMSGMRGLGLSLDRSGALQLPDDARVPRIG